MRIGMVGASVLFLLTGLGWAPTLAAPRPYDIDVILSLTGGGGFLGREEHDSLAIAEEVFNETGGIHERPIHFLFHDDQSTPQLAVQLASQVIARRPRLSGSCYGQVEGELS